MQPYRPYSGVLARSNRWVIAPVGRAGPWTRATGSPGDPHCVSSPRLRIVVSTVWTPSATSSAV